MRKAPQGTILKVDFAQARPQGHEQEGIRPAVLVGVPDWLGKPLYAGLIVVPFSSRDEKLAGQDEHLYPMYLAGSGGLTVDSFALIDQVRFVDGRRILTKLGELSDAEYAPIERGLRTIMNF